MLEFQHSKSVMPLATRACVWYYCVKGIVFSNVFSSTLPSVSTRYGVVDSVNTVGSALLQGAYSRSGVPLLMGLGPSRYYSLLNGRRDLTGGAPEPRYGDHRHTARLIKQRSLRGLRAANLGMACSSPCPDIRLPHFPRHGACKNEMGMPYVVTHFRRTTIYNKMAGIPTSRQRSPTTTTAYNQLLRFGSITMCRNVSIGSRVSLG